MRRLVLGVLLAAACSSHTKGGGGGGSTPKGKPLTAKEIVQQASPAIVFVEVGDGDQRATGTGFIVDKTGLIATNLHVVRGNTAIKVKLYGGEVYPATQIVGYDLDRDLAVLRIKPAKALPTVRLGDSDQMSAGDQIITIGNPLGVFDYTVSSGLVSQIRPVCTAAMVTYAKAHRDELKSRIEAAIAKARAGVQPSEAEIEEIQKLRCTAELTYFQISAPISQGSSGGPLFNQSGEVVGVTTAIIGAGQNINLAIPTNYLKPIVKTPVTISLDDFAKQTYDPDEQHGTPKNTGKPIERRIPDHALTVLDGCKPDQIVDLENEIWGAIGVGAPIYNKGEFEACFRIYEGVATKIEHPDNGTTWCKGVRNAFGDGLLRVNSLDYSGNDKDQAREAYKLKAWVMRDTFDGLLDAAYRWRMANPGKWDPQKLKQTGGPVILRDASGQAKDPRVKP